MRLSFFPCVLLVAVALASAEARLGAQTAAPPSGGAIREYCERASKVIPTDLEGRYQLGLWCREQGLGAQALELFRAVIALDPDHAGARGALGHVRHGAGWIERSRLESLSRAPSIPATAAGETPAAAAAPAGGTAGAQPASSAPEVAGATETPAGSAGAESVPAPDADAEAIARKKEWAQAAAEAFQTQFATHEDDDFLIHTTFESTRSPEMQALLRYLKAAKKVIAQLSGARGSIWPQKAQFILLRSREEYARFADAIDGVKDAVNLDGGYTAARGHTVLWRPASTRTISTLAESALDRFNGSGRWIGPWLREGFAEFVVAYIVSAEKGEEKRDLFRENFLQSWQFIQADPAVTIYTLLEVPGYPSREQARFRGLAMTLIEYMIRRNRRGFQKLVQTLKSDEAPPPPGNTEEEFKSFYLSYVSFQSEAVTSSFGRIEKLEAEWKAHVEKTATAYEEADRSAGATQAGPGGNNPRGGPGRGGRGPRGGGGGPGGPQQ